MKQFFDDYFNLNKIIRSKQEYKRQLARIKALPEDYQYVFKEIQSHMWQFASGAGYDMMEIHYGLIELFEEGAAEGTKRFRCDWRRCCGICGRAFEERQDIYRGLA